MKKLGHRFLLIPLCVFIFQYPCCFSNEVRIEPKERTYNMPGSLLQNIDQAIQDGNFSCAKKVLFSRNYFELNDKRLLILLGIPDYLCASNSFLPVTVDDQGNWLAGPILPGAPSLVVPGPDNALWLAAQWQVEGTFPALYRSLDGVNWKEIKLPGNRDVDCCFERLDWICFRQGAIRLKFASDATGKTACWEAGLDELAGSIGAGRDGPGPVWKRTAIASDGEHETPCPSVPLGQGSWIRNESDRSGGIIFKRNDRRSNLSVIIPNSLDK